MRHIIRKLAYWPSDISQHILLLQRVARWFLLNVPVVGPFLAVFFRYFIRVYSSCDLSPHAQISESVQFPHPIGIVIGDGVIVRENVKIWQQVTLGSHGKKGEIMSYPLIESDALIFCNSSVIGDVKVGKGAIVGAHSLVLNDVPDGSTFAGAPAKIVNS